MVSVFPVNITTFNWLFNVCKVMQSKLVFLPLPPFQSTIIWNYVNVDYLLYVYHSCQYQRPSFFIPNCTSETVPDQHPLLGMEKCINTCKSLINVRERGVRLG